MVLDCGWGGFYEALCIWYWPLGMYILALINRYIGPTNNNNNNNKKQKMMEEKCQEAYYNQLHLLSNLDPKVF